MFGPPGIAYVYLVYGMYDCLNIVTEPAGSPAALLIRAVEPTEGIDAMRTARLERWRTRRRAGAAVDDTFRTRLAAETSRLERLPAAHLARGPGLVAAAFGIERTHTGLDMTDPASPLRIEAPPLGAVRPEIVTTPRIGIDYAGEPWAGRPWRFAIAGNRSVSGPSRSFRPTRSTRPTRSPSA